jgi:predicted Zn-dependent peptidase
MTANILSVILGEGSSSRLFQRLREKNGIAYQINSFLSSFSDISIFGVYLSTNKKNINKAEDIIFNEMEKLSEGKFSEREIEKAKKYMIGTFILSMENYSNRSAAYANQEIYLNKVMTIDEAAREINSITSEEIYKEAKNIFKRENFSILCLTNDRK